MGWLYLFVAGVLEIGWAVGLKNLEGGVRPLPALLTFGAMAASLALLALAMRSIPLGTLPTRSGPASASSAPLPLAFLPMVSRPVHCGWPRLFSS